MHLHPLQGQKINQENFLKILKLEMQITTVLQFEVLHVKANVDSKSTFDSHPHFQLCSLCLKVMLLPHLYLAGHQWHSKVKKQHIKHFFFYRLNINVQIQLKNILPYQINFLETKCNVNRVSIYVTWTTLILKLFSISVQIELIIIILTSRQMTYDINWRIPTIAG